MTLLTTLLLVKSNIDVNEGLCRNILAKHANIKQVLQFRSLYMKWPKYSGDSLYPVPYASIRPKSVWGRLSCWFGFVKLDNAELAYKAAYTMGILYEGEYGKLRLELLDWCIAELSAD